MLGTRGIVRAAIIVALMVGVLTGIAPADRRGSGGDACAPGIEPKTLSQAKILRKRGVRVQVAGGECVAGDRIEVDALSKVGDERRVTRRRSLSADASRTLELPLNGKGRKRLRRCVAQELVVRARADGGARTKESGALELDGKRCPRFDAEPAPGGGLPPGGAAGSGGGQGAGGPGPGGPGPDPEPQEPEDPGFDTANAERCDFLDPSHCMYPFPNDHFTVGDEGTDTGRRINFHPLSVPRNRAEVPINPLDYSRNDGFSPGNMLITKVPGLDSPEAFAETGAVPITDIGQYDAPDQPVVVIDAATGERHPIWSEIDSNPLVDPDDGEPDPEDVTLLIRPAVNFEEDHRYIVALRDMRDADGDVIEAQRPFRVYRDGVITDDDAVEARREHFEEGIFGPLSEAGIARDDLFLAWDFTVASERNISERSLSIRDDAFAQLGDAKLADMQIPEDSSSPQFEVTSSTDFTAAQNANVARRVEGTVTVPCYLDQPGCPTGSKFAFDPTDMSANEPLDPVPGDKMEANFICNIPRSALEGASPMPARPSLYGHGLLGSAGEVNGGNIAAMSQEHGFMFCATDWVGFSTGDIPTVATILQDLSNFPKLVDRTQQGFVNFMYLGRAMLHPEGFASAPAFQTGAGAGVIDDERLFYDGNSQGGILGGSLTALAPDFDRAVLGVPGMNYSTLLRRSVDFDLYARGEFGGAVCDELPDDFDPICEPAPEDTPVGLYDNYPDQLERPLILSMIQMLWDRGEANGYAHHMTADPLPNTPPHEALLHVAFGDHQVAQVSAEVEARTIGAVTNLEPLDPGRHSDVEPLWNIPRVGFSTPHPGSAIVYWDSGSPTPPTGNIPPRDGEDPHGHPRNDVKARQQKAAFLSSDGAVTEVCGGGPCYANGYTGAP